MAHPRRLFNRRIRRHPKETLSRFIRLQDDIVLTDPPRSARRPVVDVSSGHAAAEPKIKKKRSRLPIYGRRRADGTYCGWPKSRYRNSVNPLTAPVTRPVAPDGSVRNTLKHVNVGHGPFGHAMRVFATHFSPA